MLKREQRELGSILSNLDRGTDFLLSDRILVCAVCSAATTTLDFTNAQGQICTEINKRYGSELVLLYSGIEALRRFLEAHNDKT